MQGVWRYIQEQPDEPTSFSGESHGSLRLLNDNGNEITL